MFLNYYPTNEVKYLFKNLFTAFLSNKKMKSTLPIMIIASLVLCAINPSETEATVCNGLANCYATVAGCAGPCKTQCVTIGCYATFVCALSPYCTNSFLGVKCTCS